MSAFRDFELQAIPFMADDALSGEQLALLREIGAPSEYRYTGSGNYLTVKHSVLPQNPRTLSEPAVVGISEDVQCGFVVHLDGDGVLVLECHTWGAVDVPEDMRDRDVKSVLRQSTRSLRAMRSNRSAGFARLLSAGHLRR
jgi:hypothetical protein